MGKFFPCTAWPQILALGIIPLLSIRGLSNRPLSKSHSPAKTALFSAFRSAAASPTHSSMSRSSGSKGQENHRFFRAKQISKEV